MVVNLKSNSEWTTTSEILRNLWRTIYRKFNDYWLSRGYSTM